MTNLRWGMALLIAALVLAASIDGMTLMLAGWPDLSRIAVASGMAIAVLPAGLLLDWFGVRRVGLIAAGVWIASMLIAALAGSEQSFPGGFSLADTPYLGFAGDVGIGMAGSTFLPLAVKATAYWFPRLERGRATSIFIAASNVPLVVALSPFAPHASGEVQALGAASLAAAVALAFAIAYRDPAGDARVTYAERTYIVDGGAQPADRPAWTTFASLIRSRAVWGMAFGFGAFSYAFGIGAPAIWSLSYNALGPIVNVLAGGVLVDALVRRRGGTARTVILVAGLLCACATLGMTGDNATVGAICTAIALIGLGAAQPVAWSIPGLIAPAGTVGTVAAIMSLAGMIGAAAAWMGGADAPAAAAAAVIGALCYALVPGRIEPLAAPGL